jgi:hypothetical protein
VRSTEPASFTLGFARTVCPRSVVNSIVSTSRELRLSRLPLWCICAETTRPSAC